MSMIFGADSVQPVTTKLTNGYDLYTWVMRMNTFPAFWGRNITGDNPISMEEIEFLREKHCKIVLMINDLSEIEVSSRDGTQSALRAVEAAKALGVPVHEGIALFAEIGADWSVNHNWMISFAQTLCNNGYVPGFIGNTDSALNFNFNRQCGHFVHATQNVGEYGAVYWATEPKPGGEPTEWTPFCPSDLTQDKIGLWQHGQINFGGITANETYAHDKSLLDYMWQPSNDNEERNA